MDRSYCLLWVCFSALCALPWNGGCALRHRGEDAAEEAEEQDFIVGSWAFKRLEQVEQAVAEERYGDAREIVAEMQANDKLNSHEQALAWQALAQIQAREQDYKGAIDSFERCYALHALPKEAMRGVQYNLGQLYVATERYEKAIETLEAWLAAAGEASPEINRMLASAYVQTGQFKQALRYSEALLAAEDPPTENTLQLALAVRVELKHYRDAVVLLKQLIHRFPKKTYWTQLAAAYAQLKDGARALAALELAYNQGFLTSESELMQLAYRYLHEDLPLKAATLIDAEMERGRISRSYKQLEVLANAWMAARELGRALKTYEAAASEAETGELYLRLAQLYAHEERWAKAIDAAERALRKGDLKQAGNAYLVLGTARYHAGQGGAARAAFTRARSHESSRKAAEQWLEALREGEEGCPTGQEPACALLPGAEAAR